MILAVVILYNLSLTVVETDYMATASGEVPVWLVASNYAILVFYALELVARFYVERNYFFRKTLNLVDLTVLASDIVVLCVSADLIALLLTLRPLRLLRIAKSIWVMQTIPELANLVLGMIGACKALFWGVVFILFVLCMWGVLAVRIIHPLNQDLDRQGLWEDVGCERCPRAFETVAHSMLTFIQQIIAGDSWGVLAVPIIEHYPSTAIFFGCVLFSVQLAILNLLLAVVLDKANESRQNTARELLAFKDSKHAKARSDFLDVCKAMDEDGSGFLTLDEIETGFDEHEEFRNTLRLMDVERQDLWLVFRMLDDDHSGSVQYEEFADQLFKMRTSDVHTMIAFIRFYVSELWRKGRRQGAPGRRFSVDSEASEEATRTAPAEVQPPRQQPMAEPPRSGASAWAAKLNQNQTDKCADAALSEDTDRLHKDLTQALTSISQKIEAQTQMLESLPLLMEQPCPFLLPGSRSSPTGQGAPAHRGIPSPTPKARQAGVVTGIDEPQLRGKLAQPSFHCCSFATRAEAEGLPVLAPLGPARPAAEITRAECVRLPPGQREGSLFMAPA